MQLSEELKKAFTKIEKALPCEKLMEFKNTPKDKLSRYHFGLGTWIRNNLLNEQRSLYKSFYCNGILRKDDMSHLIIELFHQHLSEII